MANKNFVLFDPVHINNLLPLAFTRPVADFRVGVFTIRKKCLVEALGKVIPTDQTIRRPLSKTLVFGPELKSGAIPAQEVLHCTVRD